MKLYKLTNSNDQTMNATQWGENITNTASGEGDLCSPGWIHAYESQYLAILMDRMHAEYTRLDSFHLWEAEGEVLKRDNDFKIGCTKLTTLKRIAPIIITEEQRIEIVIKLTKLSKFVSESSTFTNWANQYLYHNVRNYHDTYPGTASIFKATNAFFVLSNQKLDKGNFELIQDEVFRWCAFAIKEAVGSMAASEVERLIKKILSGEL